jgi:hypothetical protein
LSSKSLDCAFDRDSTDSQHERCFQLVCASLSFNWCTYTTVHKLVSLGRTATTAFTLPYSSAADVFPACSCGHLRVCRLRCFDNLNCNHSLTPIAFPTEHLSLRNKNIRRDRPHKAYGQLAHLKPSHGYRRRCAYEQPAVHTTPSLPSRRPCTTSAVNCASAIAAFQTRACILVEEIQQENVRKA